MTRSRSQGDLGGRTLGGRRRWRELPAIVRDSLTALAVAIGWFGGFFLASGRPHDWSGYDRT